MRDVWQRIGRLLIQQGAHPQFVMMYRVLGLDPHEEVTKSTGPIHWLRAALESRDAVLFRHVRQKFVSGEWPSKQYRRCYECRYWLGVNDDDHPAAKIHEILWRDFVAETSGYVPRSHLRKFFEFTSARRISWLLPRIEPVDIAFVLPALCKSEHDSDDEILEACRDYEPTGVMPHNHPWDHNRYCRALFGMDAPAVEWTDDLAAQWLSMHATDRPLFWLYMQHGRKDLLPLIGAGGARKHYEGYKTLSGVPQDPLFEVDLPVLPADRPDLVWIYNCARGSVVGELPQDCSQEAVKRFVIALKYQTSAWVPWACLEMSVLPFRYDHDRLLQDKILELVDTQLMEDPRTARIVMSPPKDDVVGSAVGSVTAASNVLASLEDASRSDIRKLFRECPKTLSALAQHVGWKAVHDHVQNHPSPPFDDFHRRVEASSTTMNEIADMARQVDEVDVVWLVERAGLYVEDVPLIPEVRPLAVFELSEFVLVDLGLAWRAHVFDQRTWEVEFRGGVNVLRRRCTD